MINGRAFDWESLNLTMMMAGIAPITIYNLKSVDYSDTRGVTPTYGLGGAPRGYGRRNYRAQGSLEMADESYAEFLKAGALVGGIYNLRFNLNLRYGDNPYSKGYSGVQNVLLAQCVPQRRGGASRQGASEARIMRIEYEILGGVSDLALDELAKL